jgi:tetratricopeptide (TPR) repeat protein
VRVRHNLAETYIKLERYPDAERELRHVLAIAPYAGKARLVFAKVLVDQGKYWEGIAEYEKVLAEPEADIDLARLNLELVCKILEDKYQKIIDRDPNNAQAHYSLGVVYSKQDKFEQAVSAYQRAIHIQPDYKEALYNLAVTFELTQDVERAVQHYEMITKLNGKKDDLDAAVNTRLKELLRK